MHLNRDRQRLNAAKSNPVKIGLHKNHFKVVFLIRAWQPLFLSHSGQEAARPEIFCLQISLAFLVPFFWPNFSGLTFEVEKAACSAGAQRADRLASQNMHMQMRDFLMAVRPDIG